MKRLAIFLLLICTFLGMPYTTVRGEKMKTSNFYNRTFLVWDNQVYAVSSEKKGLYNTYNIFNVLPDKYIKMYVKYEPFWIINNYQASGSVLLEQKAHTMAPLSYFVQRIDNSFCNAASFATLDKIVLTNLSFDENERLMLSDGRIIKVHNNESLFLFNEDDGDWDKIQLPCKLLINNLNKQDSCLCINYEDAVFYSPSDDKFYCFPTVKGKKLVNFILHNESLFYSDEDGIYVCSENASNSALLIGGDDLNIDKHTEFCIDGEILYVYDREKQMFLRRSTIEEENEVTVINIVVDYYNYIIHDGIIYAGMYLDENHHQIIKIYDLESDILKCIYLAK